MLMSKNQVTVCNRHALIYLVLIGTSKQCIDPIFNDFTDELAMIDIKATKLHVGYTP